MEEKEVKIRAQKVPFGYLLWAPLWYPCLTGAGAEMEKTNCRVKASLVPTARLILWLHHQGGSCFAPLG